MVKVIYFVRHGQTVANTTGQTQGPDDPLNAEGIRQAGIIAERSMKLKFDCIISSDYPRALVTAETIQSLTGKPLQISELLREFRRPSEFWGRIPLEDAEVYAGYEQIGQHFGQSGWHFSDEENFDDLKERGIQSLELLLARKEERLLVVTHGNFLRNLLGIMLHEERYSAEDYLDLESTFEIGNTSISIAEYKHHWRKNRNKWMLRSWNDYAHLG
jgi:broad specificity phosphatase PhoE